MNISEKNTQTLLYIFERIKHKRLELGKSLEDLSAETQTPIAVLKDMETPILTNDLGVEQLFKICKHLDMSFIAILSEEEN